MQRREISSDPMVTVSATEAGEIVLEQLSTEAGHTREMIRIPHDKVHQVTVWMRRLAAEFDGLPIPPDDAVAGDATTIEGSGSAS